MHMLHECAHALSLSQALKGAALHNHIHTFRARMHAARAHAHTLTRTATRALRMALDKNQRMCTLSQALMKHQVHQEM